MAQEVRIMNNLYTYLAPFLADTFGFQEVIDVTDGMGILDDCSAYKGKVSRTDINEPYQGSRMVCSWIRSEDIISGTKAKLMETFRNSHKEFDPAFVMLSNAPVSSMIGTDLEDVADTITRESGIPAASVDLNGHKYYDHGISQTLLALAKLLVEPAEEKIPFSVNLLGGNAIDWSAQTVRDIREWVTKRGFQVISQWGGRERTGNLKQAAKAEVNLVTAASGLATAKWMKREFGIPYIAATPFGTHWCSRIAWALREKCEMELPDVNTDNAHILILGEQLTSNAIRAVLQEDYYVSGAHVATFFLFDKSLALPGDQRLKSEDALKELLHSGVYDTVIGDRDLSVLAPDGIRWIDLPHGAIRNDYDGEGFPKLTYFHLSCWLEETLLRKD